MAVLANIGRTDMVEGLARRIRAVVTAGAAIDDTHMVELCRSPCDRRVTVIAGITALYVGRVFPRCRDAIVARIARPLNLRVING